MRFFLVFAFLSFSFPVHAQVTVSSADGGYSIGFPSAPTRTFSGNSSERLQTDLVHNKEYSFVMTIGLYDNPDVGGTLDTNVADYIKAWGPSAHETSVQKNDYVTAAGAKIPSRKFTFESDGGSGKGIIIISGHMVLVAAGNRYSANLKDDPIDEFLSSFKFEVPSSNYKFDETTASPIPEKWNSVAATIWRADGKRHVSVGYSGIRSSREEAIKSAEDFCQKDGQGCKAVGAWNSGCVFIVTGSSKTRVEWFSDETNDKALEKCRNQGLNCKTPIGGCVN